MSKSPEQKAIEKIVKVLVDDSTLAGYVAGRVYASHISTIQDPAYPAISVYLASSRSVFSAPGMVEMSLQIDCWLPAKTHDMNDVLNVHKQIRALLDRAMLSDTRIGVVIAKCNEINGGPLMYEEDTDLFHYPVEYSVTAA